MVPAGRGARGAGPYNTQPRKRSVVQISESRPGHFPSIRHLPQADRKISEYGSVQIHHLLGEDQRTNTADGQWQVMKRLAGLNPIVESWHLLPRPERMTDDAEVTEFLPACQLNRKWPGLFRGRSSHPSEFPDHAAASVASDRVYPEREKESLELRDATPDGTR